MAKRKTGQAGNHPPVDPDGSLPGYDPRESASADQAAEAEPAAPTPGQASFPIVGIGASAGGLAAFEAFFATMPPETESGMAIVLVQHLDPGHKSILTELIRRYTKMRVEEVDDGLTVEANTTYIIPSNKDMALLHGRLHLMEPAAPRGLRLPIDFFFRSLAQDQAERAICIVLSGAGTDGTLGLRAVKEAGGMVMVQAAETAAYEGMPRSAIATGLADFILPPKDMPAQLIAYAQHMFGAKTPKETAQAPDPSNILQKIVLMLRTRTGHDFSLYKQSTIRRRIERRMAVNQIERIDHYMQHLRKNQGELDTLFHELLIGVTGFFRDPQAFEALRELVIPHLFENKAGNEAVRVWVAGCSTGEEAYSIAILLQETVDRLGRAYNLQVFATDIDQDAIERARSGLYPASIAADVSAERLARFFTLEQDFYHIKKSIRDLVIFADQDLIKDPPFSKIDLLCCRNLLIYMEQDLQKKVLPMFHYALRPGGHLFLGNSESIGEFGSLFEPLDRKWKIFRRRDARAILPNLVLAPLRVETAPGTASEGMKAKKSSMREVTERLLLGDYAPASVLVNQGGEILYVHGRTGKYLELPPGEINTNVLRSAREGMRLEMATGLHKVATHGGKVHFDGLQIQTEGGLQRVNLVIMPAAESAQEPGLYLVIFEDVAAPAEPETKQDPGEGALETDKDQRITALERELRAKDEYLQSTIEELETANEELKSTNEELQSTNEELQSTNEEMETSKEELQSINEELVTVNTELQQKIDGLTRSNNDMNNLLAGTGIGTIFVDYQLGIQRFTPAVTHIVNLIQTDVGRPLSHIMSNLVNYDTLVEDTHRVLDTLVMHEAEVQTRNGSWYLMRILPYRTLENVIEGAVINFVDISTQKQLQALLQESQDIFRSVIENSGDAIWAIDAGRRLTVANQAFTSRLKRDYGHQVVVGQSLSPEWMPEAEREQWNARYQRGLGGESFREEITLQTAGGGLLCHAYSFNPIRNAHGQVCGVACFDREFATDSPGGNNGPD